LAGKMIVRREIDGHRARRCSTWSPAPKPIRCNPSRRFAQQLRIKHMPRNDGWLNMVEMALSILTWSPAGMHQLSSL
jgi:hypothetical protein